MSISIEIQVFKDKDDREWNNDGFTYYLRQDDNVCKTSDDIELLLWAHQMILEASK